MNASMLELPGTRLRSFVRGSGPMLLLVAGGPGDARANEGLATRLADRYTVVTHDRRGLSGSTTEQPPPTLTTHADDLSRLLAAHTAEPVYVYGTSIGAMISLELALEHPEQVSVLVAHEPPVTQLLPEHERALAAQDLRTVEEVFEAEGAVPAMRRFATAIDIDPADREDDVEVRGPGPQQISNFEFFLTYDLPALVAHRLDVPALKDSPVRIVPAVGASSGHVWPHWCAKALAAELGTGYETLPGGHNGYVYRPSAHAERLHQVLEAVGRTDQVGKHQGAKGERWRNSASTSAWRRSRPAASTPR